MDSATALMAPHNTEGRAGDQGACLIQVVTEAPSIANGGSSVGRETIRVVFDAQIKSMVYYTGTGTPVDYTEFQADMSKVICDHSPASEKVKMCASDINVIVLNHLESANMTTAFDFLVNKGTTAISGADITDTLELGRIANPSSLFKFPIASFEYFSPTTASYGALPSLAANAP
jgi:hypothetical protein